MNPAILALIMSSLGQAADYAVKLVALVQAANDGKLTDEAVLRQYQQLIADYQAARHDWDAAGDRA